jgi:hypothetical protein
MLIHDRLVANFKNCNDGGFFGMEKIVIVDKEWIKGSKAFSF